MIFSNEPGIYFNDFLLKTGQADDNCKDLLNMDKIREYMKEVRGIRIEDNFVVKKNGSPQGNYVNLTAGLPKKVEDIERWMADDTVFMDEFFSKF